MPNYGGGGGGLNRLHWVPIRGSEGDRRCGGRWWECEKGGVPEGGGGGGTREYGRREEWGWRGVEIIDIDRRRNLTYNFQG